MKSINGMIPDVIKPMARRIHRGLFSRSVKARRGEVRYDCGALKCIVSYNRFGGYCVPESSRHRPAAQKILANDVYEPATIDFIRAHCSDGDVVHAGTYFGDFLPALSRGAGPAATIWAFEPNRESYRCARITMEINGIQNVVLANAGLGARQESLFIQVADENGRALGGASRIVDKTPAGLAETEPVRLVTIDQVVGPEKKVSIIQLDVEGHEKEALTGALETIRRCRPIILLEVWPGSTLIHSDWFAESILGLGYRKTDDIHGNSVFRCEAR